MNLIKNNYSLYNLYIVMLSFWYSVVKWLALKPLVKLSYILNGRIIGKKK